MGGTLAGRGISVSISEIFKQGLLFKQGQRAWINQNQVQAPLLLIATNDALECRPMSRRFAFPNIPMQNKNWDYADCLYLSN